MASGHHDRTKKNSSFPLGDIIEVSQVFSSIKLGEGLVLSPNLATSPARHLVSIFKVAAKNHAPLDADLI
jgi:hypothetical protein